MTGGGACDSLYQGQVHRKPSSDGRRRGMGETHLRLLSAAFFVQVLPSRR